MADAVESALTAAEKLELSLEELDVSEFDLPEVATPPTLESILNEPDDDNVFEDESQLEMFRGDQADTMSVSSMSSASSHDIAEGKSPKKQRKSITYEAHGSILRHVVLKGISAQLNSASERVDAGMPTAVAVSQLIAIGTSHGLVLVFDPKQVLKWCLGSTAVGAQYGAVSALSFNRDCTRLLCGFARGQITMWDITNGKLLRTITDAHPPGSAVLHVKFTDELTVAVCSDSGGSVFELEFKRLIGVRTCESKCLFSGSRGEVCAIEPLHMNYTIKDHPMKDVMILAMATFSKVLIVTLRPQLKVMFSHPLKGDSSTLPLLAWQFVVIQVSDKDRVIDPVLAFGRDSTIHFFQVICVNPENIKFSPLQKIELPYKILSVTWLNARTVVILDRSEQLHVVDVRSEEELEVLDVGEVQLVYGSSYFKSLATGGNVSKALAYAGDSACYQSLVSYSGQLLLLGTKSVHCYTLRNWTERIDVLVRQGRTRDALSLAYSFYQDKAKAVVGLLGGLQKRRQVVADKMMELLYKFVDKAVTTDCPESGKMEELEEYFQSVVPVCVDYCLLLGKTEVLFSAIYDQFSLDPTARGVFLECLEPYILSDQLTHITPVVMKAFIDHYQSRGMLQSVEACIVHMDVGSLDIHQIVILCWKHGLYDAILYVYNHGMREFVTPLEELLRILRAAVSTGKQLTNDEIRLGNKLLVYISCCLAGRAYPMGDIPEDIVQSVKDSVFHCLTALHTKDGAENEAMYPQLRTLLLFDTREFLNVLALAFEEAEFNTRDGVHKRQRVVDILLKVMVESEGFSPSQVGILFTFLARQMARHENTIFVDRVLFEQVLEFLSQPGDDNRHEERQQALLELLNAGGLQQFDDGRLLHLAENAKFYRVCELLYERRREFDKILSCYWRDQARKHQAFSYVKNIMTSEAFSTEEKLKVQSEALSHLEELVSIDSKKTAQMVLLGFSTPLEEILKQLEPDKKLLYEFLKGVIEYKESSGSAIHSDRQVQLEPAVHEQYIELMCQYQPTAVYSYIKAAEGYRLEETLELCRKYKVSDATAFLLEKKGDVQGAFNINLETLQARLKDIQELLKSTKDETRPEKDIKVAFSSLQAVLLVLIQLCQRNSSKIDEAEREKLWFPLFEAMMAPQRRLKDDINKQHLDAFKELTSHVLNSMMGYISMPAILQKIMQDPAYSNGKFGEVRELIMGMLDTYNYETTLLHTCNSLLNHDLHQQLAGLKAAANRAIVPKEGGCNLCAKLFVNITDNGAVIVFRCGHSYHAECLKSRGSFYKTIGQEQWTCYLCSSTKRGHLQMTRIRRSSSGPSTANAAESESETRMNEEQLHSVDTIRKMMKTPSRLAFLEELSRAEVNQRYRPAATSLLHNERFQLRLAPPPSHMLAD
ncbi:vacuolar protein sorting-associated protein 8 homolog isoform X2 [Lingula anatina]|uniref:Vacuolar protein sorting-associated protein 8 homolog isoform X2 n=1 Tax=Lingula anatina TaxID=7574 RepID=A0A1S3HPZ4_LINAN|nr:vacuolar protein sorting-associated protein 8 homolog isoform X2 [Lingula anatina]|eukprot:XP_013387109.1 vacuolar protein sorting-associated protein 8 homolog isoform X2 [Lingula anatina]